MIVVGSIHERTVDLLQWIYVHVHVHVYVQMYVHVYVHVCLYVCVSE